jgi:hypothetical protein
LWWLKADPFTKALCLGTSSIKWDSVNSTPWNPPLADQVHLGRHYFGSSFLFFFLKKNSHQENTRKIRKLLSNKELPAATPPPFFIASAFDF